MKKKDWKIRRNNRWKEHVRFREQERGGEWRRERERKGCENWEMLKDEGQSYLRGSWKRA